MGLIYALSYQHHDPGILTPVIVELTSRGHNIMAGFGSMDAFLRANGPRAAILVADVEVYGHAEGQALTKLCRVHGIPSISIQHGVPGDKEYHQHTANILCVWGEAWMRYFDAENRVVTGNPAADVIATRTTAPPHQDWPRGPKALLIPSIRPDVMVGELGDVGEDPMDRARFYFWKARETGWGDTWLVRPHPSDTKYPQRMEAYQYIIDNLPATMQDPRERTLYDVLPHMEYVYGTSTAVLEGLLFGCRVETVNMPFVPDANLEEMFYQVDGKAAARVADVVEEAMRVR